MLQMGLAPDLSLYGNNTDKGLQDRAFRNVSGKQCDNSNHHKINYHKYY